MTEEFVNYIRPLIQAELTPIMTDGLPRHFVLYGCGKEAGDEKSELRGMGSWPPGAGKTASKTK